VFPRAWEYQEEVKRNLEAFPGSQATRQDYQTSGFRRTRPAFLVFVLRPARHYKNQANVLLFLLHALRATEPRIQLRLAASKHSLMSLKVIPFEQRNIMLFGYTCLYRLYYL
jgi:hypothetical protein